jgi:hypothetical protein
VTETKMHGIHGFKVIHLPQAQIFFGSCSNYTKRLLSGDPKIFQVVFIFCV